MRIKAPTPNIVKIQGKPFFCGTDEMGSVEGDSVALVGEGEMSTSAEVVAPGVKDG